MAQAAGITTAIRQLMSRGRPPKSTSPVRQAYTELIAALAGNVPHPIYAGANADDLNGRAEHLEEVLDRLDDSGRVRVLLDIMGQTIPVSLGRELVIPAA